MFLRKARLSSLLVGHVAQDCAFISTLRRVVGESGSSGRVIAVVAVVAVGVVIAVVVVVDRFYILSLPLPSQ